MPSEAGRAQGAVSSASRLENALRAKDDLKLVAYMMAGHPNKRRSIEVGKRLAGSGIAALEIGIPHSDPLADGSVIQHAGQVALEHGMTVSGALGVAEASQAGVAGVIVPDLPIEEAEPVTGWFRAAALETIFMVAPTTPPDRITSICSHSSGFVYCVTVTGITGARKELPQGMPELLREVRKRTQLPVAAGFGISRPEHMKSLRGGADAAVVGSAIVEAIERGGDAVALVKELLKACR
ncbi:MAG: tryptophan synthase subunit alpha [Chloroflexi bacterium]|nr:MAG: tryptophan synthase subunit alpha [Chloroflexota bacterium]